MIWHIQLQQFRPKSSDNVSEGSAFGVFLINFDLLNFVLSIGSGGFFHFSAAFGQLYSLIFVFSI